MIKAINYSIPRIVVSGLRGGSGKTILSLCLIALWRKKGLRITPFKKGPDYIDAGWLAKAAGNPCFNLDLFMMSRQQVYRSFITHAAETKLAVIEGNRGLYDGVDHKGSYSTAEIAKLIKAPVIMVIDCTKATNTIAAVILGCQKMDPGVSIKGVVLNRIATGRQESLIRKAISQKCKLPVFGAIPRLKQDPFPERHMGLTPIQEHLNVEKSIEAVAEIGSKYLNLDGIMKVARKAGTLKAGIRNKKITLYNRRNTPKIGVIRDSAFQFYYPENFEELKKRGAELVEVSPLRESKLPDIDALYVGGGFPETHAIPLSRNTLFRSSLCKAIESGLPVYAECGGLMYLGKKLVIEKKTYPMAGIFPIVFDLQKKPQAHGYTIIKVDKKNPFYPRGRVIRGHEFHYSRVIKTRKNATYMSFTNRRGRGIIKGLDGICYKNVLGTYTHVHALGTREWAEGMVRCAKKFKNKKSNIKIKE